MRCGETTGGFVGVGKLVWYRDRNRGEVVADEPVGG